MRKNRWYRVTALTNINNFKKGINNNDKRKTPQKSKKGIN